MRVEVVFETHSLSADNKLGIATGWPPGQSEDGRRLAAELGERRREDDISVVFTSDLRRAIETAYIAFAGSAVPLYRDSIATRRALLPELVDRDVLVACGLYPGSGIGRVVTRDGRVVWEEAL